MAEIGEIKVPVLLEVVGQIARSDITLRDIFAACSLLGRRCRSNGYQYDDAQDTGEAAYRDADAMLEARSQ